MMMTGERGRERAEQRGSKCKTRLDVGCREVWVSSNYKALCTHICILYSIYNTKSDVYCKILLVKKRNCDVLERK